MANNTRACDYCFRVERKIVDAVPECSVEGVDSCREHFGLQTPATAAPGTLKDLPAAPKNAKAVPPVVCHTCGNQAFFGTYLTGSKPRPRTGFWCKVCHKVVARTERDVP